MSAKFKMRVFKIPDVRLTQEMAETMCVGFGQAMEQMENPITLTNAVKQGRYWNMSFQVPCWWAKKYDLWWGAFQKRMENLARPVGTPSRLRSGDD